VAVELYVVRLVDNALVPADPAPFDSETSLDLERALLREIIVAVGSRPIAVLVVPTKLIQTVNQGAQPSSRSISARSADSTRSAVS
jgi:hypothetical protein